MKVLLITKSISEQGGLGRYSRSILDGIKKAGVDCLVATESKASTLEEETNILKPLSRPFLLLVDFFVNIVKVRRLASRCDIIHALDGWPYGVYGYFAVLGINKKLFINGVGTYSIAPFKSLVKGFLLKQSYLRSNMVFCISNYTKKRILDEIYIDNIRVVFLGTTEMASISADEIEKYKIQYNLNDNCPVLLTVGAIKTRKGQFDTFKAAGFLKARYPNFKYIMVGSDNDAHYLDSIKSFGADNGLENNLLIVSKSDDKELAFFYNICDVFLLNSTNDGGHFEGFGLTLLEAAQFGKPVIGSKDCGIEDALKDGFNGYLTEQGNVRDIYEKILLVLQDKDRLSVGSKEWYKQFSWDDTVAEYLRYYFK